MKKFFPLFASLGTLFGAVRPDHPSFPYPAYAGPVAFERFANHLDFIGLFLPDDPVILEAGAHYGTDTVNFAQVWPKSTIFSFEPNPHAYELFAERTRGIPNVHGYPFALNAYNGDALLYVCYGTTGDNPEYESASSLLEPSEYMKIHYQGPKVKVPCVVLDDWCRQNQVDRVDLIWFDLEGIELEIFKSSPEILKTVRVIFTETNFRDFRIGMTNFDSLNTFLNKAGFRLLAHWYDPAIQGNAIFVRKDLYRLVPK